jgi:flagellar basal-body rod modification protein FlgD
MVSSTTSTTNTQSSTNAATTSAAGKQMDENAFLNLLVTELKNQDPMNPMDNKDFIAQLAQFSSLQEMQNLNTSMKSFTQSQPMLQGASLIGRTVTASDSSTGDEITGVVKSVKFDSGKTLLNVNGQDISLDTVTKMS